MYKVGFELTPYEVSIVQLALKTQIMLLQRSLPSDDKQIKLDIQDLNVLLGTIQ